MSRGFGPTQQKILLLLLGGITLGLTRTPRQYFRVAKAIGKEWRAINRRSLDRAIHLLYESKLVETKDNRDGTLTLVLSEEGKQRALRYDLDTMELVQPKHWDGKWRVVMFDVPEPQKRTRESLRMHFKDLGFYEFQKSVFVHPYPCKEEVEYIMEFYNARRYVRFIIATELDNGIELKKHFGLSQ